MYFIRLLKFKINKYPLFFLSAFLLLTTHFTSHAQQGEIVISGEVISAVDGLPLPGVSVVDVNNPTVGAVTDFDGTYQIKLGSGSKALRYSYVGYVTQEILINNKSTINVSMSEDIATLNEVVVVGYGEKKKITQTGAVETVRFSDVVNQPVTNSGQLMYGKFSGVQITQASGLPGADASSVTIRGVGSFGGATPLIVIDNIQYDGLAAFNNLAPSDIESVSVLKDASASAIYGARAANGVIIVTTKKGKSGSLQIDYSGFTGFQSVTVTPEYLDAANYARLKNEADINTNGLNAPLRYSEANIQAILDGSQPDRYANTKWSDEILRSAPIHNHYLSFSGGTDKTTFRASIGYLDQEAVVKGKFESKRYNFSLNLNSKIKDWLTLSSVTNAYWRQFRGPAGGANAINGNNGIITQFQRSAPTIPAYYSNGEFGIVDGSYENVNFSYPIENALFRGVRGNYEDDEINIAERLGLKFDITKDLSFETSGSVNLNFNNISNFSPSYSVFDYVGELVNDFPNNSLTNTSSFNYRLINENILRYAKTFNGNHSISVLLGHSVIYNKNDGFTGRLEGFPSNGVEEFDGGGVVNPEVTGGASDFSLQSFFTSVNYTYKDKYIFDFSVRKDGSSRFGPNNRYADFPSGAVAWRISEENFLQNVNWLSELKFKASYGVTGNDDIGNYIFQQNYNSNIDYLLGNDIIVGGVALTGLANPTIQWESIEQLDLGVDIGLFKNRLNITSHYFKRDSKDILYTRYPIPNTIGVTNLAAQNAASMTNSGLEFSLNYRGAINDFKYDIGGSFTKFDDNEVTSLGNRGLETIDGQSIIRVGEPFRAYFGYQALGVFQTPEEVAEAPRQFGNNRTAPGDLRYADLSGPDGTPDGVVDAFDRTVIGNPYPELIYNMVANASYKGIDINVVFEGVSGLDRILNGNGQIPFAFDRNNSLSYWIDRWTPENPSTTLPRVGGQNNEIVSSFYVQDASYLRLRNLEIGYTVPTLVTQKFGIDKLRVFFSGQNLLTFTKMENFDPERRTSTDSDQNTPLYKVYSLGFNIKL
ncbi:TonB-linked SusC/RagA family outer membrane protein [Jejuia pallidilutea]|uniref:TonB-linked SusC/RagA family outer membrane protein n=1 Tax=Jejuia pallidilutea TaxID=504487 RepID=A0A362X701_9FLAO|nr:TonB-dependent receptor [Jejuia pallidilutea]PQV51526.1 TonB-linked SusC/RagA family outer membrane protein [Jejuia pallidilutea]